MNMLHASGETAQDKRRRLARLLLEQKRGAEAPPGRIRPRRSDEPPPLSFAQQRLWFLDRLVPGSPFYNIPAAVRVQAPLDLPVLKRTLDEIARRHEALRTSFREVEGKPVQVVAPGLDVPLVLHDLRGLDPAAREREVLRLATEDARTPFDLARDPLVRAAVLWLDARSYVFLINLHHIIADGWSMGVLVREFQAIHAAFLAGRPSPLPPLEIQYGDFALWQRRQLAEGRLAGQLAYWERRLANLPILDLATDFPHRTVQGFEGETLHLVLPRSLSDEAAAFSRRNGVTLFVTLLAAFNALLHRYCGQDDIVIGEPVANRNRAELEPLIGFFVNSLVLRTDASGDPTFRELLRRSREVVLEADANQDVPFELLVERLKAERSMGRNPLFQVSLQYFDGSGPGSGARISEDAILVEKGTASLDLAFDLFDTPNGILVRAEYSTELFRRETIERMVRHYEALLEAFTRDPDLRLSRAPMLSERERRQILAEWNRPAAPQHFTPVHRLFEAQAARRPDAPAVEEPGGRSLSYRQLDAAAGSLAATLRRHGVGPEAIVATVFDRSIEAVVALLAVWKSGGAYMPLDPSHPPERLRLLLADARPVLALAGPRHAEAMRDRGLPVLEVGEIGDIGGRDPAPEDPAPENLAYVIHTSGSSGTPKGVMVEHGAIARHLCWMQAELPLGPEDRVLLKYALTFDVSFLEMAAPLIAGARIVVAGGDAATDMAELAALVHRHEVTAIDLVPSMLEALLDQRLFAASRSIRRIVCGGEAMPASLLDRLLARPGIEVINMYGPTEATISATFWRAAPPAGAGRVPIGRPAGPYTAYVLDRHLNPLPAGIPGELCIGGPCLARGYLNRPDATRERFVHDPFAGGALARLYRTGDRCRFLPDGTIEYLGRMDEQVKVRGHRIELGEIEAALADHPRVRSCAAAVRTERDGGEIAAYVVPNAGEPEFWPSVGEYFVYDELLYHVMTADRVRMRAYRSAITRSVRGKTVLDIGTGADLALARMCLEAGARRVYAVEMLEDAAAEARRLAEVLGAGDRLVVVQGDSRRIELPEKVDVCVSELIGTIGSSEGVVGVLNDARRFLRPYGEMIPHRCVTRIAAVCLPDGMRRSPAFGELPRYYAEKVFERAGRRFDLRVCAKNLPSSSLLSDAAVFEDLAFDRPIEPEQTTEIRLEIGRPGLLDGFLLWINLHPGPEELIDARISETSWLPVFVPAFSPPLPVRPGDTIVAACSRLVDEEGFTPDYLIRGVVVRGAEGRTPFEVESPCMGHGCGTSGFYRALFDRWGDLNPDSGQEGQRIVEWRKVYEEIYGGTVPRDPGFDTVGWNSSYDGRPLGEDELREQVEATAERIRALDGRRILEIGCGTGLLLLRLAGGCERYVGTDFSSHALGRLGATLEERGWTHVELRERAADDFSDIEPGGYDVVVLNSVIQYFPGMNYLVRVLEGALRALRPGGHVFVGDVRNLRHQRHLHLGIELAQSGAELSAGELRERVAQRVRQEPELVVDPTFFPALPGRLPGVAGAAIEVKRGRCRNELTRFRYDAVLRSDGGPPPLGGVAERSWEDIGSAGALRVLLEREAPAALVIRGVPNARLTSEQRLLERLDRADPTVRTSELLEPEEAEGVEPEALWELAHALPYRILVGWALQGEPDRCDLLCVAGREGEIPVLAAAEPPSGRRPWSAYASAPAAGPGRSDLGHVLREHLRTRLPEYMLPAAFVMLDALPLMASGKLDRRALPAPDSVRTDAQVAYAAPETDLHRQILDVWNQVLGAGRIGIDANFFNIGGHSLLAMQVVSRLGDRLGREVPLRLLFERPTIRSLAEAIEAAGGTEGMPAAPPVVPAARPDAPAIDLERLSDENVDALLARLLSRGGGS
jgi:amino acid adenylation domain-containing protein